MGARQLTDNPIRILVIDDQQDITSATREVLESCGYQVLTANSGEQGLEIAFTEHPDLILLDVMMPGMDGFQVCRELQFGYTKDIPVVFLTAKTQLASMVEANRSGASAFIPKPFRIEQLVQTVRDVLRDASVYFDDVTGLPTLAHVQVDVARRLTEHHQLGLLYVSLDGIFGIEQVEGFESVDDVFRLVGQKLCEAKGLLLRADDYISISSLGNAFLIILTPSRHQRAISEQDLSQIKERLEDNLLRQLRDELEDGHVAKIGVYVGSARLAQSPKVRFRRALLQAIDKATRDIQVERDEDYAQLVAELDTVLAEEKITCVFQAIVNLTDFSVLGYEVLARGPLQSRLHRPDVLFEIARDLGRVEELDRVCRGMAALGGATLPDTALRFINTDPTSLSFRSRNDRFVQELVAATPEPLRGKTVVEITERSVIDDFGHVRDVAASLREHGFRIAVDDAGVGYSGLQTIVEVEPDFIKLDMSLIRRLDTSPVRQKLIRTLRDFCLETDTTLIAEGIETEAQLRVLNELRIPYGQGFLFARPDAACPTAERIEPGATDYAAMSTRQAVDSSA